MVVILANGDLIISKTGVIHLSPSHIPLHVKVSGTGPHMVLIHGLFGSMDNLNLLARHFQAQFTVHQADMRNHGLSPHDEQMDYDLMAEDLNVYLRDKAIHSVVLIGHSMGGKVAMQMALAYPGLVKRLIVLDIAPVRYPPHHNVILSALNSVTLETLQNRKEAEEELKKSIIDPGTRAFLLKSLSKTNKGFAWKFNLKAIIDNYENIMQGQNSNHSYDGDVLFVGGGESDYLQPEYTENTKRLFPNSQVKIVPGVGHWLHAEKPELIARICLRFLNA